MSADTPNRAQPQTKAAEGPSVILPQQVTDPTILESVAGFITDVVPSSYNVPNDTKEQIQWCHFVQLDFDESSQLFDYDYDKINSPPLLLVLGYTAGVQVWAVPSNGEAVEILSWKIGTVRVLKFLPTPYKLGCSYASDNFSNQRPLIALCDSATPGPQFCSLCFISLKTGEQVKLFKFKNPVLDVQANRRSVVVAFTEKIAIFDAFTLEDRMTVTSCYLSPGINSNPIALGTKWMAYAENKLLPSKKSGGGNEGEGVQSYTATMIHAAKSFGRGLRELGETVASSLTGNSPYKPSTVGTGGPHGSGTGEILQKGIVTVINIENKPTSDSAENTHQPDNIVAHFIAHTEAIVQLLFDPSGLLLLTADKRGHDFHLFKINAHPLNPALASVHHLYVLHRGDTTAKVQDMCFSPDSRWVTVSTLRGTTHVFPVTPYGGHVGTRTHATPHVVNRMSRFHRSAGLTSEGRSNSPVSQHELPTNSSLPYNNPRVPPYPHPTVVNALAQIRQPVFMQNAAGGQRQGAGKQRSSSTSEDSSHVSLRVSASFGAPRAWIDLPTQREPTHAKPQTKPVESLFIISCHGSLVQYDLEPRSLNVPKEKLCDDTPIELVVTAKAQWVLQRQPNSIEIQLPMSNSNIGLFHIEFPMYKTVKSEELDDKWLSQVEILTHAGPHRRLWMGPQFTFKTYSSTVGASMNILESQAIDIGKTKPVNMPANNAYPVLIECSSLSSCEPSPKLIDMYHRHFDDTTGVGETQLKEDLAEAMMESPAVRERDCCPASKRQPSGVTKVVNPLGTVITVVSQPDKEEEPLEDAVIHENCDEALFRPVVASKAILIAHPAQVSPLPAHKTAVLDTKLQTGNRQYEKLSEMLRNKSSSEVNINVITATYQVKDTVRTLRESSNRPLQDNVTLVAAKNVAEGARNIVDAKVCARNIDDAKVSARNIVDAKVSARSLVDDVKIAVDSKTLAKNAVDSSKIAVDSKISTKSAVEMRDSTNNAVEMRDSTKNTGETRDSTKNAVDSKISTKNAVDSKISTKNAVDPIISTKNAEDSKMTTKTAVDSKITAKAAVDSKISTKSAVDAKISTKNLVEMRDSTNNAVEMRDSTKNTGEARDSTKNAVDSKISTKNTVDTKTSTKNAVDMKISTKNAVDPLISTKTAVDKAKISTKNSVETKDSTNNAVEMGDSTKNAGETRDSTKNAVERKSSTKYAVDTRDFTKCLVERRNSTKNAVETRDSTKCSVERRDSTKNTVETRDSTKNLVDTRDFTKNLADTRDSTKNLVETRDSTKNLVETRDSTKYSVDDAKVSTKITVDYAKASTKNLVDDAKISSRNTDTKIAAKNLVDDSKISTKNIDTKISTKNTVDTKVSTKNKVDTKVSTKSLVDDAKISTKTVADDTKISSKKSADVKVTGKNVLVDTAFSNTEKFSNNFELINTDKNTKCANDDYDEFEVDLIRDAKKSTKKLTSAIKAEIAVSDIIPAKPEIDLIDIQGKIPTKVDNIEYDLKEKKPSSSKKGASTKNNITDEDLTDTEIKKSTNKKSASVNKSKPETATEEKTLKLDLNEVECKNWTEENSSVNVTVKLAKPKKIQEESTSAKKTTKLAKKNSSESEFDEFEIKSSKKASNETVENETKKIKKLSSTDNNEIVSENTDNYARLAKISSSKNEKETKKLSNFVNIGIDKILELKETMSSKTSKTTDSTNRATKKSTKVSKESSIESDIDNITTYFESKINEDISEASASKTDSNIELFEKNKPKKTADISETERNKKLMTKCSESDKKSSKVEKNSGKDTNTDSEEEIFNVKFKASKSSVERAKKPEKVEDENNDTDKKSQSKARKEMKIKQSKDNTKPGIDTITNIVDKANDKITIEESSSSCGKISKKKSVTESKTEMITEDNAKFIELEASKSKKKSDDEIWGIEASKSFFEQDLSTTTSNKSTVTNTCAKDPFSISEKYDTNTELFDAEIASEKKLTIDSKTDASKKCSKKLEKQKNPGKSNVDIFGETDFSTFVPPPPAFNVWEARKREKREIAKPSKHELVFVENHISKPEPVTLAKIGKPLKPTFSDSPILKMATPPPLDNSIFAASENLFSFTGIDSKYFDSSSTFEEVSSRTITTKKKSTVEEASSMINEGVDAKKLTENDEEHGLSKKKNRKPKTKLGVKISKDVLEVDAENSIAKADNSSLLENAMQSDQKLILKPMKLCKNNDDLIGNIAESDVVVTKKKSWSDIAATKQSSSNSLFENDFEVMLKSKVSKQIDDFRKKSDFAEIQDPESDPELQKNQENSSSNTETTESDDSSKIPVDDTNTNVDSDNLEVSTAKSDNSSSKSIKKKSKKKRR